VIRLLAAHPRFELAFVTSRELDGQRVADHNAGFAGELRYSSPDYRDLAGAGRRRGGAGAAERQGRAHRPAIR